MKWFDKWFYQKAKQAWDNKHRYENDIKEVTLNAISMGQAIGQVSLRSEPNRLDTQPDLSFRMFRAENGYVMQVHHSDRKTERQHVNLHVITEDQDLGQAISHIITLESLKVS
jgi:hypothetical protein